MSSSITKPNPIIALHDISLDREGVHILNNINWEIYPGEHWAIIGKNAAGKTLLLKIIATYLWPSRGRIKILGEEFGKIELQRLRHNIGWVSSALEQDLSQEQTVLEIVLSGYFSTLRLFSKPPKKVKQRAKMILHLLELNDHKKQSFATLSVGERKKVLIARAILKRPRILILDEVCAGLDPVARKQYLDSLRKLILKENDISVLFVTHHLEEIFPEITHVLGLNGGKVIFAGKKEDVLTSKNIFLLFGKDIKFRKESENYYIDIF